MLNNTGNVRSNFENRKSLEQEDLAGTANRHVDVLALKDLEVLDHDLLVCSLFNMKLGELV